LPPSYDAGGGAALQSTLFTIFFLFAGFLIVEPQIATTWIWMYYLSFIRYPLDFLLSNEFSDVVFDCDIISDTRAPSPTATKCWSSRCEV